MTDKRTFQIPIKHVGAVRDAVLDRLCFAGDDLSRARDQGAAAMIAQLAEFDAYRDFREQLGWTDAELSDEFIHDGCWSFYLDAKRLEPARKVLEWALVIAREDIEHLEPDALKARADLIGWLSDAFESLPTEVEEVAV